jgi:hypothetical protein
LPNVVILTDGICCKVRLGPTLPPPPWLEDVLAEGKGKAKERREVGEGDDTVVDS